MPDISKARVMLKFILLNISLALIILAIARPQYGMQTKEVIRNSAEIVIALDVSKSMDATDIQPSRIEKAKNAILRFLKKSQDNIALIVFAGDAYIQVPITNDYSGIKAILSSLSTDNVSKQGTNISSAIDLGMKSFTEDKKKGKAIIIITDGENHEEKAIEKAKEAVKEGVMISTIGMGKLHAVPIPDRRTGDFKKKRNGEKVLTKLNEDLLKKIAEAGNGTYTRANNISQGLKNILTELNKLEKTKTKIKVKEYEDYFIYIAMLVLFLLILEFIILERKNKKLSKVKLFD